MKKTLLFLISIIIIAWIFENYFTIRKNASASNTPSKLTLSQNKKMSNHLATSKNVATDLYRGTFDATSKTNRIAIANDILNQVNLLDNLIANSTPDEINWINTEVEATKHELSSSRRVNLVDSAEFQKYKLKGYLSTIIIFLRKIINSDNLKVEMYCWGYLSSLLIDELTLNDALYTLKVKGKFPREIELSRNMCIGTGDSRANYNMCYHSFGEGILSYILIPYLQNEKMNNQ